LPLIGDSSLQILRQTLEETMYSKVYWITSGPGDGAGLMDHYDTVVTEAIQDSQYHVGHQMIQIQPEKWTLISNYRSAEAAEAAGSMVRDLVGKMSDRFGMTLEVIGEGETIREVS
jgi:hypothetical protein